MILMLQYAQLSCSSILASAKLAGASHGLTIIVRITTQKSLDFDMGWADSPTGHGVGQLGFLDFPAVTKRKARIWLYLVPLGPTPKTILNLESALMRCERPTIRAIQIEV